MSSVLSPRSCPSGLEKWAASFGYQAIPFDSCAAHLKTFFFLLIQSNFMPKKNAIRDDRLLQKAPQSHVHILIKILVVLYGQDPEWSKNLVMKHSAVQTDAFLTDPQIGTATVSSVRPTNER